MDAQEINIKIEELKTWTVATHQAKVMELEACMRFILRTQPFCGFFDGNEKENEDKGFQGRMFIDQGNGSEPPTLFVNWDEVNVFENQQEFFESVFIGDFSSDKTVKITGVRL
jgi:hypothetical protein